MFIHYSSFLSFTKYLLSISFVPDTPLHTGNTEGNNAVSGLRHKQVLRRRTYENVFIVEVPLTKITTHFHNLCSFPRFSFLHSSYQSRLYHPLWRGVVRRGRAVLPLPLSLNDSNHGIWTLNGIC